MNLDILQKKFNTNKKCLNFLEKKKWGNTPYCPFCESTKVYRRKGTIKWHCNKCNRDFTVLYGTIFEKTGLPLTNKIKFNRGFKEDYCFI